MKFTASFLLFLVLGCLVTSPVSVCAYDVPDFDYPLFSADGIFLEDADRESLLQALSSLASNFEGESKVDDDLKEKAIAIALRIDPLHYSSRMAHGALWEGKPTTPIPYFTSLSSVSEVLWTTATLLSKKPLEPEEAKLAPYLMDLSLAVHASTPKDRLLAFAEATPRKKLDWDKFLILSTDKSETQIARAHAAAEIAAVAVVEIDTPPAPKAEPAPPSMKPRPPGPENPPKPDRPVRDGFSATLRKMPAVLHTTAVESMAVPGEISVMIRPPDGSVERDLFPFIAKTAPSEYEELPLFPGRRSLTISNLDVTGTFPASRDMEFPPRVIGEVTFEEKGSLPGPRRLSLAKGRLPALLLVEANIKDLSIDPDFTISGDIVSPKSTALIEGSPLETVTAAAELGTPYLLYPESGLDDLVSELQESPDGLQSIFDVEVIAFNSLESAVELATSGAPASLQEASAAFAEIKLASTRMPLLDFAANAKVQERLEALLSVYPGHFSALALLEFGRRPVSNLSQIKRDLSAIKGAVKPFLILAEVDTTDYEALKRQLEPSDIALSRMRTTVAPAARDYFGYAEDILEAADLYLQLTNKTSSIGRQRLEQVEEAIEQLETEEETLVTEELE